MRNDWFAALRGKPATKPAQLDFQGDVGDAGDEADFAGVFASPGPMPAAVPLETLGRAPGIGAIDVTNVPARAYANGDAKIPIKQGTLPASPASPPKITTLDATEGRRAYKVVRDADDLASWVGLIQASAVAAVDLETTGLDPMSAELVGISLAIGEGAACYIPVGHVMAGLQLERDQVLSVLKPIFADPTVRKVFHHAQFDVAILNRYGAEVRGYDDSLLASYALDSGRVERGARVGHGLKELARRHFGIEMKEFADVVGRGRSRILFHEAPIEVAASYAAADADITLQLWRTLAPRLNAEGAEEIYRADLALIPVLVGMEGAGILVDADRLRAVSRAWGRRIDELERAIHVQAGEVFNLNSGTQLANILFDKLSLPIMGRTATGKPSTDDDALSKLAAQGHELPAKYLEWRRLQKRKRDFADALPQRVNLQTGRIHGRFNPTGTVTGRLSASSPNLQQIPARGEEGALIRETFIAPPGHVLIAADYSQIELRILAHVSAGPDMIAAFHSGHDFHTATAAAICGVPQEQVTKEQRSRAKATSFGLVYGITPVGLAKQIGASEAEAQAFMAAYFARFPGVKDYIDNTRSQARQDHFVTTLFGRKIHVPDVSSMYFARRSRALNLAINAPIQGTAADLMRRAMVRLPLALQEMQLEARMLLTVHDELVIECPTERADAVTHIVRRVMETAGSPDVEFRVPIIVETGTASNWKDAK